MNTVIITTICKDQGIRGKLKNLFANMSNKKDFKNFKAMTEKKTDFSHSKLVTFPSE